MKEAITQLIGRHVAARRTERELTQVELAGLCGVSRQALSAIERGAQAPRWETLYALAGVLRCEVFDLIPSLKQVQGLRVIPMELGPLSYGGESLEAER